MAPRVGNRCTWRLNLARPSVEVMEIAVGEPVLPISPALSFQSAILDTDSYLSTPISTTPSPEPYPFSTPIPTPSATPIPANFATPANFLTPANFPAPSSNGPWNGESGDARRSEDDSLSSNPPRSAKSVTTRERYGAGVGRDGDVAAAAAGGGADMEEETEDGSFYFETDHLALKGNPEYQSLLKTVALLEAQRTKAIQDLDRLVESEGESLRDPIGFVYKLQHKIDLDLPKPQQVAEIPPVPWEAYTSNLDYLGYKQPKHLTRHTFKKQVGDTVPISTVSHSRPASSGNSSTSSVTMVTNADNNTSLYMGSNSNIAIATAAAVPPPPPTAASGVAMPTAMSVHRSSSLSSNSDSHALALSRRLIRGRIKDESKPQKFNELWTAEEQKRLEDLLIQYPPEEVEMRRWEKIARTLNNRTTKQVQSRVQKYFIKLAKAGLPIPGRMPNVRLYEKKGAHRHQRNNRFLFPSSTFLTSHEPPVYMADGDDDDAYSYAGSSSADIGDGQWGEEDISDEEELPAELRVTAEYQELMRLKRLRRQRLQEHLGQTYLVRHIGYKCDRCDCEPIVGARWHCAECPKEDSVDFCDNCADFVFETDTHKCSHRLEAVHQAETWSSAHQDRDYTKLTSGDYNYLDPNYMPAS